MKRPSQLFILLFGLVACQPKGSLIYQYPKPNEYQIDQVMVVIDYLNLRDDVGKYWDFDSYYHQKTLNLLLAQTNEVVHQAGYPLIQSYLLTSGLLIKNNFPVEHYIDEQLQTELLYPPFILAKKSKDGQNIDDQQITQHQEFLGIMVKYMATRRHLENDELSHRGMQMGYHFESMDLADNTAILYIHINQSAAGITKQLGTLLLTGAIASQADYAHVGVDLSAKQQASAFLVHQGSGQILWKNHSSSWSTEQPIKQLLTAFPKQHQKPQLPLKSE